MTKLLTLYPDNRGKLWAPPESDEDMYGCLVKEVGGYIEWVTLHRGLKLGMYINEEGKLLPDMKPNPIASYLFHQAGGSPIDIIMGPVVLASHDEEGYTRPPDIPYLNTLNKLWRLNLEL